MASEPGSAGNRSQHVAHNQADTAETEQTRQPRGKGHVSQKGHEEPAGDGSQRSTYPPQHGHQEEEDEHKRHEVFHTGCRGAVRRLGRNLEFTAHDFGDGIHTVQNALVESARAELGHDPIPNDSPGRKIRQAALQAVAHLDPDLAVVARDHQDDAVVEPFATDLPAFGHPDRKIFDGIPIQGGYGEHRHLGRVLLFQLLEEDLDPAFRVRRQHAGVVVHPALESRHLERRRRVRQQQRRAQQPPEDPAPTRACPLHRKPRLRTSPWAPPWRPRPS